MSTAPPPALSPLGDAMPPAGLTMSLGLWQSGGWLNIGLNTTLADLVHSSLVRAEATCLAEAARFGQSRGEINLGDSLIPTSGLALALVAVAAEIEAARLQPDQTIARSWLPVLTFLENSLPPVSLPLAVKLKVSGGVRGSAFVPAPAVRGASASLQAAAASLTLDAAGMITAAAIALLPQSGPLFAVEATSLLIGRPIDSDRIAAAAQQTQIEAQTHLGPTFISAAFPVEVAAHLVRKALDRAAARCLAQLEAGA